MSIVTTLRSALVPDVAHIFAYQCELKSLLQGAISPRVVADYLDGLDHNTRLAAIRSLSPKHLKNLFDAVSGFRNTTIDDVVPPEVGVRVTVRHYGKNSLPAFTIFEKRFLRPSEGTSELWGFNFQTLAPVTGPGYFVARNAPDRGEVDIDYTAVPSEAPAGWPTVQPNERGISTLVYAHMVDRLRGVTSQVSIGRAWKKGKIQPAWFILCRE
jgi:hypothetical protein